MRLTLFITIHYNLFHFSFNLFIYIYLPQGHHVVHYLHKDFFCFCFWHIRCQVFDIYARRVCVLSKSNLKLNNPQSIYDCTFNAIQWKSAVCSHDDDEWTNCSPGKLASQLQLDERLAKVTGKVTWNDNRKSSLYHMVYDISYMYVLNRNATVTWQLVSKQNDW